MLIHAHSLSFYCFFILGSHWARSRVRGSIGDPRVGVPIGAAPGSGVPLGIPGLGFPLGLPLVRASRTPGPLGPA